MKTEHAVVEKHVLLPKLSLSETNFTLILSRSLICTGNESLRKNHKQEPKLSFLVNAIYVYAYALEAYSNDVCGRDQAACPALKKSFNHSTFFVRKLGFHEMPSRLIKTPFRTT
jgi:hypothetical protein